MLISEFQFAVREILREKPNINRRQLGNDAAYHVEAVLDDFANANKLSRSKSQVRLKQLEGMTTYRIPDFLFGEGNLIIELTITPIELTPRGLRVLSSPRGQWFRQNGRNRLGTPGRGARKYEQIADYVASGKNLVVITLDDAVRALLR